MGVIAPTVAAQQVLRQLYDSLLQEDEKYRSREEFYPTQIERLPALLGWKVEKLAQAGVPRDGTSDLHGVTDYDRRLITLSTRTLRDHPISEETIRFTLAHELGHVSLHQPLDIRDPHQQRRVLSQRSPMQRDLELQPRAEIEANAFAAELLMPERIIRSEFLIRFGTSRLWNESETGRPLWNALANAERTQFGFATTLATAAVKKYRTLSTFFGVSPKAAAYRLVFLELVKCPR